MAATSPSPAVKLLFPTVALVGSAAVTIVGAILTSSANTTLTNALTNPAAATTAAEVYGSQSSIQIYTGVLTAGIVGIFVSLAAFAVLVGFGVFSSSAEAAAPLADEYGDIDDVEGVEVAPVAAAPAF